MAFSRSEDLATLVLLRFGKEKKQLICYKLAPDGAAETCSVFRNNFFQPIFEEIEGNLQETE